MSLVEESKDEISIHAAREGGDKSKRHRRLVRSVFQSTPPVKAATIKDGGTSVAVPFQSTPPVKAATRAFRFLLLRLGFQSTPPVKAATGLAVELPC